MENAFRLYQAADSQLVQQMRAEDVASARAESARQMKEGAYQLASVFVQFGELTYRYDQLLDDVDRYMKADEQFHKAMAASPPGAFPPPTPIPLPAKLDFLECSHYHVGDIRRAGLPTTTTDAVLSNPTYRRFAEHQRELRIPRSPI